MNILKKWFLLFLCLMLGSTVLGQVPFLHYSVSVRGMEGETNDVCWDDQGFTWIASDAGLYRYDGRRLKHFPTENFGDSLQRKAELKSILFDAANQELWLASDIGLLRFDLQRSDFQSTSYQPLDIFTIFKDDQSQIWLGTRYKGLWKYDVKGDSLHQELYIDKKAITDQYTESSVNKILCFAENPSNSRFLYYGTGKGLVRFNRRTKDYQFLPVKIEEYKGVESAINDIEVLPDGRIYCTTWLGTLLVSPGEAEFQKVDPYPHLPNRKDPYVSYGITPLNDSLYHVNYMSKGLFTLNVNANRFDQSYPTDDWKRQRIDKIDPSGNYWKTLFGALYFPAVVNQVLKYPVNLFPGDHKYNILNLIEAKDGQIYCAAGVCEGVFAFNRQTESWKMIPLPPTAISKSLDQFVVRDIVETQKWGILVITENDILQYKNGGFEFFPFQLSSAKKNLARIIEDKKGNIWVSSYFGELWEITTDGAIIDWVPKIQALGHGLPSWIFNMICDQEGNLWVRLREDYFIIIQPTGTIIPHVYDPINPNHPNNIKDFVVDNAGRVWVICSRSGMGMIDPERLEKGIIKLLPFNDLSFEHACPGEGAELWITIHNGALLRFNTESLSFSAFGEEYKSLRPDARLLKLKDGTIAMGDLGTLAFFDPRQLKENEEIPKPYLVAAKLFKENINPDAIPKFSHFQNDLSFEFSAIAYSFAREVKYYIKLEGLHQEWQQIDQKTTINFPRLSPGWYTLKVKAANNEGVISPEQELYKFKIRLPWWKTAWFYLGVISISSLLLYYFYHYNLQRKLTEERVKQYEALHQFQNKMIGNVGHEFKTPITIIGGQANLLYEHEQDQEKRKQLFQISEESKKLEELVNQLIGLSKVENKALEPTVRQVDLTKVLIDVLESYHQLAMQHQVHFLWNLEGVGETVDTDPKLFRSITSNLLSNAIKYTPPNKSVYLKLFKDGERFVLEVRDEGPGINPEYQKQIFERFYQIETKEQKNWTGTGIGLAIVKEYTEVLGGTIELESTPNEGTCFQISFPLSQKAPLSSSYYLQAPPEATKIENQFINNSREVILIVEDNHAMQYYLNSLLEGSYSLAFASNGKEALKIAIQNIPDLIISDWMMPEMDGITFCRKIKKHPLTSHIPVLILTALSDKKHQMKGLEAQADVFLGKPFDPKELLLSIKNQLEKSKLLQQYFNNQWNGNQETDNSLYQRQDHDFLKTVRKLILSNMADSTFSIASIAHKVNISRSSFDRKIKALTGETASVFFRKVRVNYAKDLIEKNNLQIAEIAYECGYSSPAHFSQEFKKVFGESPSKIRNTKY